MNKKPAVSTVPNTQPCPCGVPASYADCCGRYHDGAAAQTAEALMRSRYSAYELKLAEYLQATWHASTRPASLDLDQNPKWLGLKVLPQQAKTGPHLPDGDSPQLSHGGSPNLPHGDSLRSQKNPADATSNAAPEAEVEFVARYKLGGRAFRLHERSRFVREDGRWYYVDGVISE